jgi:hypothetical protein
MMRMIRLAYAIALIPTKIEAEQIADDNNNGTHKQAAHAPPPPPPQNYRLPLHLSGTDNVNMTALFPTRQPATIILPKSSAAALPVKQPRPNATDCMWSPKVPQNTSKCPNFAGLPKQPPCTKNMPSAKATVRAAGTTAKPARSTKCAATWSSTAPCECNVMPSTNCEATQKQSSNYAYIYKHPMIAGLLHFPLPTMSIYKLRAL